MTIALTVNGKAANVAAEPDTPLLWVLREHLKLTGTKFGCGVGAVRRLHRARRRQGGALLRRRRCRRSQGKKVTTIEGLSPDGSHPLQKAWIAEQVPQCGYCQSGQIMQAAALLANNKKPDARADRRAHGRQHLPLRHLSAHRARHRARREGGLSHDQRNHRSAAAIFLQTVAARGLTFAFTLAGRSARPRRARPAADSAKFNAWVTIGADGTITILSPAAEMGQGALTTLPLILAEELDADWSKVKTEFAPPDPEDLRQLAPAIRRRHVQTSASVSVPGYCTPLRIAGAQARRVLLDNVAAAMERAGRRADHRAERRRARQVGPAHLLRRDRQVRHGSRASRRRSTEADLKKPSQFRLIGRKDIAARRRAVQGQRHAPSTASTCRCPAWSTPRCCESPYRTAPRRRPSTPTTR